MHDQKYLSSQYQTHDGHIKTITEIIVILNGAEEMIRFGDL
jgi:hypothetical protein